MSQRNRPGPTVRLGVDLAASVLRGAGKMELEEKAKRLLEREEQLRREREELRRGTLAMNAQRWRANR